jgi:membrane protein DedA with SNARE-associated domain
MLLTIALLILGTLASEDLTCVATGQLIGRGTLHPVLGIAGCAMGIFLGDMGLWAIGALAGRRALASTWVSRRISPTQTERARKWFERNTATAVIGTRFVPGARLPMYVAAGALRHRAGPFAFWTLVASLLWTPLVVLFVAVSGEAVVTRWVGRSWIAIGATVVAAAIVMRIAALASTEVGRAKLVARISRIWRWEFWPAWLFYVPLVPWIAWLSLRHRGFTTITAANPGIDHGGGFVGESKFQILSSLRHPNVSPTALVDSPARLDAILKERNWSYPLILKPDVGQRGAGVKLVRTRDNAVEYLLRAIGSVVIQPYHPGPFEAGIFYYRFPNEPRGRIFSITDKIFSDLIGDGVSTFEQLIWRHPRYRMQARTFLARHADQRDRILAPGERVRLAVAGNHCQGTMFRDGAHLLTPALEAKIDQIARSFEGFYFGRFDVRYSDVGAFTRGQDICVIELNGVTSESTNIYDPRKSLLGAYRTLTRQWSILFQIGAVNRRRGTRPLRLMEMVMEVVAHFRRTSVPAHSD